MIDSVTAYVVYLRFEATFMIISGRKSGSSVIFVIIPHIRVNNIT